MFCSVGPVNDHVKISFLCDGKQHQHFWIRQLIKSLLHLMASVSCMWLVLHFTSTLTSSVTADLCYMKPAARVHVSLTHTSVYSTHLRRPAVRLLLVCWLSSPTCSTYVQLCFPQSLSDPQSCSCCTLFTSARVVCAQRSQKAGMDVHLEPDDELYVAQIFPWFAPLPAVC